jgi:receptor protein-tyrosine kinase
MLPNGILISKPRVPASPSYPSKGRNLVLFTMLGIMLSVAVAIVADRMDTRVHDPAIVGNMTDLPSLAAIPSIEHEAGVRLQIGKLNHNNAFLESFRILRNNITFSAIDNPLKVIAVSSPGRAEGKSTISVNMAIAMAMDGKKVLLVDCDLRRPSIHNWMGVLREVGLTNVVKGLSSIEDAIVSTDIENVFCLPSGPLPPNPTEFLNSKHSRDLIKELSSMYDMIILDCPPCTGLSDVQVISTMADGVLLVVTMNRTLKPYLHIAMRTLNQVKAPLIGFVLNMVESRRQGYGYYYNYYYYYYDYDEQNVGDGHKKKGKRKHRVHKEKSDKA